MLVRQSVKTLVAALSESALLVMVESMVVGIALKDGLCRHVFLHVPGC